MYSFSRRDDTKVNDEPFYAHYLDKSGVQHPGRAEILRSQSTEPKVVLKELLTYDDHNELLFIKNMAHHTIGMDDELDILMEKFEHVFLIRDPADMLPSLAETIPNPTLRDTAYKYEYELFEMVRERSRPLHVIDARELLRDPRQILSELCQRLDIPFSEKMLSWNEGPIPEDGIWAKYWYHNVHKSTGFEQYEPKNEPVPKHLKPLYEQCKPYYDKLFVHAIKAGVALR